MTSPSFQPQKKSDFQIISFKQEAHPHFYTTIDDPAQKVSLISANIQQKLISDISKANKKKLTISVENSHKNKFKKLPSLKKLPSQEYKSPTELDDGLKNAEKESWKLNYMQKISHGLEQTSAINGFIHEDKVWIASDFNKSLRHIDNKYHKKIQSKEKNNGIFTQIEKKNIIPSEYQSPTNHSPNDNALERKLMLSLDPKKSKLKLKSNSSKKNFKNVGQWISNIKEILRTHEYSSLKRQLENAQEKFSQIIAEIAEALSNDSAEQSIILEYIWETHMNMATSFLEQKDQELNTIESKKEKEFEERRAELIEKLDVLVTENNILKTKIYDKDKELSKCLQETDSLTKLEGKIRDSYRTLINFMLDFKEISELKLLEIIQLKIKTTSLGLKKGEIEALKNDYDNIASNSSKEREQIKKIQNELSDLKKQASYSSNLEKINEILDISFQNYKKQDKHDLELKNTTNLHKEISIDTTDLIKTQTKSINTEKKMCAQLDKYVQTFFSDEIEHDIREQSHEFIEFTHDFHRFTTESSSTAIKKFKSKSDINIGNFKVINENVHNWKENKNNFAFNRRSTSAFPEFEEFEVFSLKKLSRNFESEIYQFIEDLEKELALNLNINEDNQFKLEKNIYNIRISTENFFKTIITRDVSRTKEILQHKINSYETILSTQELKRSNQLLLHNLNDIKLKFAEFFKATYEFSEQHIKSENHITHSPNLNLDSSNIIEEKKEDENEIENGSLNKKLEVEKNENEEKKEDRKIIDNEIDKKMRKSNNRKTVNLNEEKKDENRMSPSNGKKKTLSKRSSIMKKSMAVLPFNNQANQDKKYLMVDDADFNFDNSKFDLMKLEAFKKDRKISINTGLNENLIRLIKEANSFLPRNKKLVKIKSENFEKCLVFLMRIETSNLTPIKTITSNTLIKIISNIYSEIIKYLNKPEVDHENLNPLFFIVYDFFVQKYINSKDRAETFFLKFIQNLLSYLEIPRISFFAKLLGISRLQTSDEKISQTIFYDGHDLFRYFEHFCKLDDNPMKNIPGLLLAMNYQEHLYTALTKAIDVFNKFCNNSNNFGFLQKMKVEQYINQIKESKVDDPIISRRFVVEIDFVIERLFEVQDYINLNYEKAFQAMDVEGKEALSLQELILLVRNVENKYKYSFEKEIIEIFNQEFDYIDEERMVNCISFKRFASICHKKRWCSPIKQETFIRKHSDEIINFEILMEEFDVKKNVIKLKLLKTGKYNDLYFNLIKIIEDTLDQDEEDISVERKNITWLQYRILDQESNSFMINMEIDACLPIEFKYLEYCK